MKNILVVSLCLLSSVWFSCRKNSSSSSKAPVSLTQVWASDSVLRTPESVLLDRDRNVLYVSNINKRSNPNKDGDGFLSRLNTDGQIKDLYWVTGLNDPKGLGLYNGVLYVADLTDIVAVSVQSGAVLNRYTAEGTKMFNDITVDSQGNVFASDSDGHKIYQLSNGRLSIWLDNTDNHRPNGLLMENNRLLSALSDVGLVKIVSLPDKKYSDWVADIPSADGIVSAGNNDYFISSWNGEVHYINAAGKRWKVLDTQAQKINSADIDFSIPNQLLYVPTFLNNRVVAYQVSR